MLSEERKEERKDGKKMKVMKLKGWEKLILFYKRLWQAIPKFFIILSIVYKNVFTK